MNKKYEFLCAQQQDGTRTWWSQHSTSQQTPIVSAYCEYPCGLGKKCTSPGGVLLDTENPVRDSVEEARRIFGTCDSGVGPSVPEGNNDVDEGFVLPGNSTECNGIANEAMVPSDSYCNIFHVCLDGKRKDFRCAKASNSPYDLWWNQAIQRCDWPCNVQCSKQIFDDTNDAAAIQALDKKNCFVPAATQHPTVLPGYERK